MARTQTLNRTPIASDLGPEHTSTPDTPAPASKIAQVIRMLQRSGGATLTELVETTGWLPHTTRAALTGLRKKGFTLDKESRGGVTVYTIGKAA